MAVTGVENYQESQSWTACDLWRPATPVTLTLYGDKEAMALVSAAAIKGKEMRPVVEGGESIRDEGSISSCPVSSSSQQGFISECTYGYDGSQGRF